MEKYKTILSHFAAQRAEDPQHRMTGEQQLACIAFGKELEEFTLGQIKGICEERIKLLESISKYPGAQDSKEELSVFRKRWAEADAKISKQAKIPKQSTQATTADRSTALSEARTRESILNARNSELETQVSSLTTQLTNTRNEAQALRDRVESLENGTEVRSAREEATQCREAAAIANRNVSLLEGFCQLRGIDANKAIAPVTQKSLQPSSRRGAGKPVIRHIIRNGQPVPPEDQLSEF